MKNITLKSDKVSLCHKNNCIHATGLNAKIIAFGAFAMLVLIGISALSKNS
ncbi:hypothetical protein [Confluentibacter sediminis]|uniref:hypothetical protein n=1 Tax=Confluentibacter sediminis TaxID=2219045 RepID=UPI0013A6F5F1|nr:hypothetical protein [Confluentibacter sediminis]